MKRFFLFILVVFIYTIGMAQSAKDLVKQANDLVTVRNESGAFEKYKLAIQADRNSAEAYCGASLMCSRLGNRTKTDAEKKQMYLLGKSYAEQALKIAPNDYIAHYVMAVAMGRMALISSTKEKVAASRAIKYHADKALIANPNYAQSWHVIGKWNYEISQLGSLSKSVAKNFLGGLPDGSLDNAIKYYEKCRSLDKTFIVNLYDLAIAYNKKGDNKKAIECLNDALNSPIRLYDDTYYKGECTKLKAKWSK